MSTENYKENDYLHDLVNHLTVRAGSQVPSPKTKTKV